MASGFSRARQCGRKHRHPSEGKALAQIRSLAQRGADVARLQPYACRHCGGWHVGHRRLTQWERKHGAKP